MNITSTGKIPPVNIIHSERVAWRFPTSDVIGSHLRDDLDSYLSLVRRKIQEKYATTRDLIIGETSRICNMIRLSTFSHCLYPTQ